MKKQISIHPVGCKIEIIGGSVYPKEESWQFLCPCCREPMKARLTWDKEACEFSFEILPINSKNETKHNVKKET